MCAGILRDSERRTQQWFKLVNPPGDARDDVWQTIAVARKCFELGHPGLKDKNGDFLFTFKDAAGKVIEFCGGSVAGLTIGILGLTFKPNTDDMRDAPSLDIVPALLQAGAKIVAFDPEGMSEAGKLLQGITFAKTAYETFVADSQKIAGLYGDLAKQAFKPLEGLVSKFNPSAH